MLILEMLVGKGDLYGLEMIRESEGKLKRGTIYVTLARMEKKGYVEGREEEQPDPNRAPRRIYRPTGEGERVLAAFENLHAALAGVLA
jgi:DNA-binding PadR family transcriptional regulator